MADEDFPTGTAYPPPMNEEDRRDWLRLLRSRRVGPATFHRLMGELGSAAAALQALPEIARNAGAEGYQPCPVEVVRAEIRAGRIAGARLIAFGEAEYPALLAQLSDPPPLIWALGDTGLLNRPAVALVGTRQASSLGTRMARQLAVDLGSNGRVVVSGLARGIDTAAHLGGIAGGTIAVMPGGVDVVYPPENAVLAQEIADRGLRISDQPMGMAPLASHFLRRNRLIAGLSQAVVVVEAAARSGSMNTAREALDAGRDVMAVPGHPMDSRASGCNLLIRDGALLVRGAEDVIEALGSRPACTTAGPADTPDRADPPPSEPAPAGRPPASPAAEDAAQAAAQAAPGACAPPAGPDAPRLFAVLPLRRRPAETGARPPARQPDHHPAATGARRPPLSASQDTAPGAAARGLPAAPQNRGLRETAELHRMILSRLSMSPLAEDQLIRDLGLAAGVIGQEIVALELDGKIERRPGGYLSRLQ